MKNLYKRLGITKDASPDTIREALQSVSDVRLRKEIEYVLLTPERRRVYDRTHVLLNHIGQLRANLGLLHSPNWIDAETTEYNTTPDSTRPHRVDPSRTSRTRADRGSRSRRGSKQSGSSATRRVLKRLLQFLAIVFTVIVIFYWPAGNSSLTQRNYPPIPPDIEQAARAAQKLTSSQGSGYSGVLSKDEFDALHSAAGWYEDEVESDYRGSLNYPRERQRVVVQLHDGLKTLREELRRATPSTGTYWNIAQERTVAPLEVITRGRANYYVKLVDARSGRDTFAVFVRGGESVETKVPLGTYELRYATGRNWFGPQYLFGSNTSYHRANQTFAFRQNQFEVSGYTVELFFQTDGNLQTQEIDRRSF